MLFRKYVHPFKSFRIWERKGQMAQQHSLCPDSGEVGIVYIYLCNNSLDRYFQKNTHLKQPWILQMCYFSLILESFHGSICVVHGDVGYSYRRNNSGDLINPQHAVQQVSGLRLQEASDRTRKFTQLLWQWQMHHREQMDWLSPVACPLLLQSNRASWSFWKAKQSHLSQFAHVYSNAPFQSTLFLFLSFYTE